MQNRLGNEMVMVSMIASAVINCVIATACSSGGGETGATAAVVAPLEGPIVMARPVAHNACDGGTADAGVGQ